jgi:hypothetical protein
MTLMKRLMADYGNGNRIILLRGADFFFEAFFCHD